MLWSPYSLVNIYDWGRGRFFEPTTLWTNLRQTDSADFKYTWSNFRWQQNSKCSGKPSQDFKRRALSRSLLWWGLTESHWLANSKSLLLLDFHRTSPIFCNNLQRVHPYPLQDDLSVQSVHVLLDEGVYWCWLQNTVAWEQALIVSKIILFSLTKWWCRHLSEQERDSHFIEERHNLDYMDAFTPQFNFFNPLI